MPQNQLARYLSSLREIYGRAESRDHSESCKNQLHTEKKPRSGTLMDTGPTEKRIGIHSG